MLCINGLGGKNIEKGEKGMKKRQRLLAMLLSFGLAFGLCESGATMQEVQAQEAAEEEIAGEVEADEKEETEVKIQKEEEKEVSSQSVEDATDWKAEIYCQENGKIFPGTSVRLKAEISYTDSDGEEDLYDYKGMDFSWEMSGGYSGEVDIEPIPGKPEVYVTIPEDYFDQVKDDENFDNMLGISLVVSKDGSKLAEGKYDIYINNPEFEYNSSLTFDGGYTKKNVPLNQWIKVTAVCKNPDGVSEEIDHCTVHWDKTGFDISADGGNTLLPETDNDEYAEEAPISGNTFYIKRTEGYNVWLRVEIFGKDDLEYALDDIDMELDSINVTENDFIDDASKEKEEAEQNILTLKKPEKVTGETKWFAFTPVEDGDYKFIFECEDNKWTNNAEALYLYIEKKDGLHQIEKGWGYYLRCTLKKDTTYYLCASYDESDEDYSKEENYTANYTVTVVKAIDGLSVYCDNEKIEDDGEYYFTCERNGVVTLKVADSLGNPLNGAEYQWYEYISDDKGYTPIKDATEAQYKFEFSVYRDIMCEVSQNGDMETLYMYPSCKTHSFVKMTDPSTCESEGEEWEECTFCHATDNWKALPLGDHSGQWIDVSRATVFSPATQTRTCTVCKKTETRTIGGKLPATITTNASSIPLKIKQSTKKLYAALAAGDSVAAWTTSNKKVATVSGSANGTCTIKAGKKSGTANITIRTAAGAVKTVKVKVQKGKVKTSAVKQVPKKITIKKGQTYKLSPSIQPITSPDKAKYSSANKKVATVSGKGVIKGKKAGKAKITVKAGKKKVTCTVVVTK